MKNMLFKMILWCACAIAISAITVLVLYRLAMMIAICFALLLLGGVVGIPLVMVFKSKFEAAKRDLENEKREAFFEQFRK